MEAQTSLYEQILAAREARAALRKECAAIGRASVSLSLNIPGVPKNNPVFSAFFRQVLAELTRFLQAQRVVCDAKIERCDAAGDFYLADLRPGPAIADVKALGEEFERRHPVGRAIDVDVTDAQGQFVSSQKLKPCLLCGQPALTCMREQTHTYQELRDVLTARMTAYLAQQQQTQVCKQLAGIAVKASLYEIAVSPKPGLVDRFDRGAHQDMDYFTFLDSSAALSGYFEELAVAGYTFESGDFTPDRYGFSRGEAVNSPPGRGWGWVLTERTSLTSATHPLPLPGGESVAFGDTWSEKPIPVRDFTLALPLIREIGLKMEDAMFQATAGVNTQKGLIFLLGLALFAAAHTLARPGRFSAERCREVIAAICHNLVQRELGSAGDSVGALNAPTHGEQCFRRYGMVCGGVRHEAEAGFPSVFEHGLPELRAQLAATSGRAPAARMNAALTRVLLRLMTVVHDTNIIHRQNLQILHTVQQQARQALDAERPDEAQARYADLMAYCRNHSVSPGGSADLLAVTVFIYFVESAFRGGMI